MTALCTVFLAGALSADPATDAAPAVAEIPPAARPASELKSAYHELMRRAADRARPDIYALVPELVAMHGALDRPAGIAHADAAGMRRAVRSRLETFRDRLIRDRNAEAKEKARNASRSRRGSEDAAVASLPGGNSVAGRAQELIDLIQNTIEPDSWEVNGGRGRATFFGQLNVLVIRNTGEVHEQIGGTLGQLRK